MNTPYQVHVPIIGRRLWPLALACSRQMPDTKAKLDAEIAAVKGRKAIPGGKRGARLAVVAVANAISAARKKRKQLRIDTRGSASARSNRPRVLLPKGTPAERLLAKREHQLLRAATACLRNYAREEAPNTRWVDTLTACTAYLDIEHGWMDFGGTRRHCVVSATYSFRAMARCPIPRNIAGLLTLGAVEAPGAAGEGESVYQAVWARQGQGDVICERGYIVARTGKSGSIEYAHGATLGAARGVLSRRASADERARKLAAWQDSIERALKAGEIGRYDVHVSLADAFRAGLCKPGVHAWCARNGIDPEAGASVGQILATHDQQEYALAACLAAIRRKLRA